jgi:peroxiredoxin
MSHLKPGDTAPDFTLPSTVGDKVTLSDYRGKKNVLLLFYPLDFSPTCSMASTQGAEWLPV